MGKTTVIGETQSEARRRRQKENAASIATPKTSYNVYSYGSPRTKVVETATSGNLRVKDAYGNYKDIVVTPEGTMSVDYYEKSGRKAQDEAKAIEESSYNVTSTSEAKKEDLRPVQTGSLRMKDASGNYQDLYVTGEGVMTASKAQEMGVVAEIETNKAQQLETGRNVYAALRAKQTGIKPIENTLGSPILQLQPDAAIEKRSQTFTGMEYIAPPRDVRALTPEESRAFGYQKMWDKIVGKKRAIALEQGFKGYQLQAEKANELTSKVFFIDKIQGTGTKSQIIRGALIGAKTITVDYPIWLPAASNLRFAGETVLSGGKNIFDIGTGLKEGFTKPETRYETGASLITILKGPKISEVITRPARNAYVSWGAKESTAVRVSPQVAEMGETFPTSRSIKETLGKFHQSEAVPEVLKRSESSKPVKRYALKLQGFKPRLVTQYKMKQLPEKWMDVPETALTDLPMNIKPVKVASHATTGRRFKGKVEPGPMGSTGKEDPGLFVTPGKETSAYFFKQDGGGYNYFPNLLQESLPKGASAHAFYYGRIERYPRQVIKTPGYDAIREFLDKQKNSGQVFVTKRHELGLGQVRDRTQTGTSEIEGVIPLGTEFKAVDRSGWGLVPKAKGYRQYLTYNGRKIPVYEYEYFGSGKGQRKGSLKSDLLSGERMAREYGTYEQYRPRPYSRIAGLKGSSQIKGSEYPARSASSYKLPSYSMPSYSKAVSSYRLKTSEVSRVATSRAYVKYQPVRYGSSVRQYGASSKATSSASSNLGRSISSKYPQRGYNVFLNTRFTAPIPIRPPPTLRYPPTQNRMLGKRKSKPLFDWRSQRKHRIFTPKELLLGV